MINRKPLVTICIPNYNYGHYLEYCLESVLNQTYENIEVHFSDNASTDESYEIAYRYHKRFKEKGIYFRIHENKRNVGSDMNSKIASRESEGDFIYTLASDDALCPMFIEKCIDVFENYPNVGTVIVNREEIDENGNLKKIEPFYNRSCIISGEDQAAVYMMAGIAIPGQRMVRRTVFNKVEAYSRTWNVAGDWYDNFLYACAGDVAYLKEDLVQYRVHSGNETNESEKKLLGITEHYQLINSFVDIANAFGMKKPQARYNEAINHLGDMCLRYALRMLADHQVEPARKYMMLAPIMNENIMKNPQYHEMMKLTFETTEDELDQRVIEYKTEHSFNRKTSYDPPEGSIDLKI